MRYFIITNDDDFLKALQPFQDVVVMVDIETLGKKDRQPGHHHHFSAHVAADVARARRVLPRERVMIRINPMHDGTAAEIAAAERDGAGLIMLPMYTTRSEVAKFIEMLGGRTRPVLLAETPASVLRFEAYADLLPKGTIVHLGLNDLRLALKLNHMFEVVGSGFAAFATAKLERAGVEFGIGGVGLNAEDAIPPQLVLELHARLGSTNVILSRSFLSKARESGFAAAFGEIGGALCAARASQRTMVEIYADIAERLAPYTRA